VRLQCTLWSVRSDQIMIRVIFYIFWEGVEIRKCVAKRTSFAFIFPLTELFRYKLKEK
jgi:hypothetical protein